MILETFVSKYIIDTGKAISDLEELDKKSKDVSKSLQDATKPAESMGESTGRALDEISSAANNASEAVSDLSDSYGKAGDSAKGASDAAKRAHKEATEAAKRETEANKQAADTAEATKSSAASKELSRLDKLGAKLKSVMRFAFGNRPRIPGEGPQAGNSGGLGGVGGILTSAAGESRTLASGIAANLPGGAGLMGLVGAASAAAAAVTIFAKVIGIANEQADKAIHLRETAWKSGMTETQYNAAVIRGKRMGATEDEVRASREGLADKVRSAKANVYGEEAFWMRKAGINVGGGRDIENITKQVLNHARQLSKTRGQSEGIAWATQRMGMSFAEASRYVSMTDEQLKKYNQSTLSQEVNLAISQQRSRKYGEAMREVDTAMEQAGTKVSSKVTPSLTRLAHAMKDSAEKSDGLVSAIGTISAAVVDFAATLIDQSDKLFGYLNSRGDGLGEALSEPGIIEAISKSTGKPAEQVRLERQSKGIGLGWLFTESSRREAQQEALDALKSKYPNSDAIPSGPGLPTSGAPSLLVGKEAQDKQARGGLTTPKTTGEYAKAELDAISKVQKMNQEGTLDRPLEDVINEVHRIMADAQSNGSSAEETNEILERLYAVSVKQTNIIDAQAKHLIPPIPVQPVDIGLEQALSLWASGIGKAAGFTGPEGAAPGGSRAEYEAIARQQIEAKRYVGFQPTALVGPEATQRALMGGREASKSVAAAQTSAQLSLTQENKFNINVSDADAGRRVQSAIKQSNESATRTMVNSWTDSMRN